MFGRLSRLNCFLINHPPQKKNNHKENICFHLGEKKDSEVSGEKEEGNCVKNVISFILFNSSGLNIQAQTIINKNR